MQDSNQTDPLRIPKLLSERIEQSPRKDEAFATIQSFNRFFGDHRVVPIFFPEYTEHGIPHIQRVLDSAVYLLTDAALEHFTDNDAIVLTAGVLLHDIAMHLSKEGFRGLLKKQVSPFDGSPLQSKSWPELWREYCEEASHWDDRKLTALFGEKESRKDQYSRSFERIRCSAEDMADVLDWSQRDCMFVGEFIRRHHPRMAHEIALEGMPTKDPDAPYRLIHLESAGFADLAGVLAHSHGLSLRETLPYLQQKYHGRATCHNCHVVYLMALLRISDYLQVDSDRAPRDSRKICSVRSPLSSLEWNAHDAIEDVKHDEDDADAIFILARPNDVTTYLKLRSLFDGLQEELDRAWAVLGEVYSRIIPLHQLGIQLRRVKSNIASEIFENEVEYIPDRFRFDSAGADLLKKLVCPLYANSIEVGIRELVQNAIDAVNELGYAKIKHGEQLQCIEVAPDEIQVHLEKEDENNHFLTVTDCGIGMDRGILQSYFLRAGASFRDCEAWRRAFTENGESQVIRSGRFGVGALAAFLLGDKLEVTTRSALSSPECGLSFSASITDDAIEVRRVKCSQQGTRIRISINASTYERLAKQNGLEWDWYRWASPKLERSIGANTDLPKLQQAPMPGEDLADIWHRFQTEDFDDVAWTYGKSPVLVCNGITVGILASSNGYRRCLHWRSEGDSKSDSIPVSVPSVSVSDAQAKLPINLQRSELANHAYPFEGHLLSEVAKDLVAYCLVFAPGEDRDYTPPRYPGTKDLQGISFQSQTPWFFTTAGSGYNHFVNLQLTTLETARVILRLDPYFQYPKMQSSNDEGVFYFDLHRFHAHDPLQHLTIAVAQLLGIINNRPSFDTNFFTHSQSSRVFLSHDLAMRALTAGPVPQWSFDDVVRQEIAFQETDGSDSHLICLSTEMMDVDAQVAFTKPMMRAVASGQAIYADVKRPAVGFDIETVFAETWRRYMTAPIIPYRIQERKNVFASTYEELDEFITKWSRLKEKSPDEYRELFAKTTPSGGVIPM